MGLNKYVTIFLMKIILEGGVKGRLKEVGVHKFFLILEGVFIGGRGLKREGVYQRIYRNKFRVNDMF